MTFIEVISSIKDNFKERIKTPFLGTFTIVFIIHNWKLFYSLIYFDSSLSLDTRILKINEYFKEEQFLWLKNYLWFNTDGFFWNLVYCIIITFIVLLFSYFFKGVSQYLTNYYNDKTLPYLQERTDDSKIVLRTKYEQVERQRNKAEKNSKEMRDQLVDKISENEKLIEEIATLRNTAISDKEAEELKKTNEEQQNKILDYSSQVTSLNNEIIKVNNRSAALEEAQVEKDLILNNLNVEKQSLLSQLGAKNSEVESLKKQSADKDDKIEKLKTESERLKIEPRRQGIISVKPKQQNLTEILYEEIKKNKLEGQLDKFFDYASTGKRILYGENLKKDMKFFIVNNIFTHSTASGGDGSVNIHFTGVGYDIYNLRLKDKYRNSYERLSEIYNEIVERFPSGILAAYLLNNEKIESEEVINLLEGFTKGSEKEYNDSQSKIDAQNFIDRLKALT